MRASASPSQPRRTKHDVLTRQELRDFRPNPRTLHYLERHAARTGRSPAQLRVLDWGCGRGRTVLALRERGYQAFGVDLDPATVDQGRPLLRELGHPDDALRALGDDGRCDLEDASFDFVCSDQVLEHVADLDMLVAEQRRLLVPDGAGFHQYPGHRIPLEPHLHMPLVHWLPKSRLRRAAIALCVALGREPHWERLADRERRERARAYFDYSVEHTFYRPYPQVRRTFERAGFRVSFETIHHPALDSPPLLGRVARAPALRPLSERLLWSLRGVELLARPLPAPSPQSEARSSASSQASAAR